MKLLVTVFFVLIPLASNASEFLLNDSWDQPRALSEKTKLQNKIDGYDITGLKKYIGSLSLSGQMITIDTENSVACNQIRKQLIENANMSAKSLKDLCSNKGGRYVSIIRFSPTDFEFGATPTIGDQIQKFNFLGVGVMSVIAALPPEISNWGDDVFSHALDNWRTNVRTTPVIDQDEWMINYVGHPISGAAYYITARQTGLGSAGSFGFSVMMSTFFWEYGFEAVAEKPSIQDLILTPTIGALLGELMFRGNETIRANNNTWMGSKRLGKVGLVITDPVGALVSGLTKLGNNRYLYNGSIDWTGIPFEGPGEKIYVAPGVVMRVNFGHK